MSFANWPPPSYDTTVAELLCELHTEEAIRDVGAAAGPVMRELVETPLCSLCPKIAKNRGQLTSSLVVCVRAYLGEKQNRERERKTC